MLLLDRKVDDSNRHEKQFSSRKYICYKLHSSLDQYNIVFKFKTFWFGTSLETTAGNISSTSGEVLQAFCIYLATDCDRFVTRLGSVAAVWVVQLQIASNIRTITVWARVTIRPRLKPLIKERAGKWNVILLNELNLMWRFEMLICTMYVCGYVGICIIAKTKEHLSQHHQGLITFQRNQYKNNNHSFSYANTFVIKMLLVVIADVFSHTCL